jgi:hypothetical protein
MEPLIPRRQKPSNRETHKPEQKELSQNEKNQTIC